jgi:hypothetical protein
MSALGPDATEQGFFTGHASLNRVGEFHTRYDTNTMTIGSAKSGMQVLFMSGARATALTINASQHLVPASHLYMGITGSAGSPAIAFDTDADTGIYRKGTNELGFSTNGTERVYINDSLNVVGVGYFNEMIRISISDISSGENRGLQLLNTSGVDQQWNITAGVTGSENESFCIRDSTANVNALTIGINSGVAQFAGNVTVDSDTMLVDSAGHGYCVVDAGSTSYATWVAHKMGGTTKYLVGMEGGASAQYRIYDSGDASVAVHITTTGNSWVADSDERMKKDITPMENRLDDLLKIKVRRFKWKHNDKVDFGFVAQELETCAPDAVEVGSDEVYSKEEAEDSLTAVEGALKNPYGVSREQLIPMMVKSIQELSDKLDTANAKITALENA